MSLFMPILLWKRWRCFWRYFRSWNISPKESLFEIVLVGGRQVNNKSCNPIRRRIGSFLLLLENILVAFNDLLAVLLQCNTYYRPGSRICDGLDQFQTTKLAQYASVGAVLTLKNVVESHHHPTTELNVTNCHRESSSRYRSQFIAKKGRFWPASIRNLTRRRR